MNVLKIGGGAEIDHGAIFRNLAECLQRGERWVVFLSNRSIILTRRPHVSAPSLPTFDLSRSLIRKLRAHRTGGFEVRAVCPVCHAI